MNRAGIAKNDRELVVSLANSLQEEKRETKILKRALLIASRENVSLSCEECSESVNCNREKNIDGCICSTYEGYISDAKFEIEQEEK